MTLLRAVLANSIRNNNQNTQHHSKSNFEMDTEVWVLKKEDTEKHEVAQRFLSE
jgi:hypothetical protein